jgi:hypothetical protein
LLSVWVAQKRNPECKFGGFSGLHLPIAYSHSVHQFFLML